MSRRWVQLLLLEAAGLLLLINFLPKWNVPAAPADPPSTRWRLEEAPWYTTPAKRLAPQGESLRAPDNMPTPPPPAYYAPRFEGAAPLQEAERTEYVRRRLARSSNEFGALVNQALRGSLPPEGDTDSFANNRGSRYAADAWPRR